MLDTGIWILDFDERHIMKQLLILTDAARSE
jgi:hypothetical protein